MNTNATNLETATFAGGCFWCTESDFAKVDGVVELVSGYTGGHTVNPTYEEVCSGRTGHAEAVQVHFDPGKISYTELLDIFFKHIDPTDSGGQFADRGTQYRSAIFYHDDRQKRLAEEARQHLQQTGPFKRRIVTGIVKLGAFYPAEAYHQKYHETNSIHYQKYRAGSGRDRFLQHIWNSPEHRAARDASK